MNEIYNKARGTNFRIISLLTHFSLNTNFDKICHCLFDTVWHLFVIQGCFLIEYRLECPMRIFILDFECAQTNNQYKHKQFLFDRNLEWKKIQSSVSMAVNKVSNSSVSTLDSNSDL